jgi:hypothetical protein
MSDKFDSLSLRVHDDECTSKNLGVNLRLLLRSWSEELEPVPGISPNVAQAQFYRLTRFLANTLNPEQTAEHDGDDLEVLNL